MTFLQPSILWGLPLLLIPVIIHLVNRLRHKPQPWAAMRFLRSASQSSVSQAKLKQFLILLFRMLAIAALIIFLSRPLAGGWLGWALSPAPEVIVLVMDRSPSMETEAGSSGKSAREQALNLWAEALKSFQGASRFVLIDNRESSKPIELPNLTALKESEFTGPTDHGADLPSMLQQAYTYLVDSKSGAAEVWIASDLQESNWKAADSQWQKIVREFNALPQKVRFRLLTFDPPTRDNVSITLVEATRRTRNQQSMLEVTLDLNRRAPSTDPILLKCNINGTESQNAIVMEGQSLRWRGAFPLGTATGSGFGKFELPADANARDNTVYFAYEPEQNATALVVSTELNAAQALSFAAADLTREELTPAKLVSPEDFPAQPLTNVALIAWNAPIPSGVSANALQQFANSGGEVVFFPASQSGATLEGGFNWGQPVNASSNELFKVAKWNEMEGPFARTEEGLGVPLPQLEVVRRAPIAGNGTVLASFADSAPFLVRKVAGRGEIYFCATLPDPAWSSLADGPVLVPMLQRLLAAGARRVNAATMVSCDEISRRDVSGWTPVSNPENAGKPDPRIHAGIYRTRNNTVAVNRPAYENNLEKLSSDQARQLFANLSFQFHQDRSQGSDRLQGEVWRMFVFGTLIFLLVEGLLVLPPKHHDEYDSLHPKGSSRREAEVAA